MYMNNDIFLCDAKKQKAKLIISNEELSELDLPSFIVS